MITNLNGLGALKSRPVRSRAQRKTRKQVRTPIQNKQTGVTRLKRRGKQ